MIKNKYKIALCVIGIIAIIAVMKLWYRTPERPALIPTTAISHSQQTGGVPERASAPTPATTSSATTQPGTPVAARTAAAIMTPQQFAARTTPENAPSATPHSPAAAPVVEHKYVALGATPNDTYYPNLWQLQKVNAPAAWSITTGAPVIVADIDTGFALQHEDLQSSWYTNPGETGMTQPGDRCWTGTPENKATNNCDDDGNGYVDDWRGWNFYGRYTPTANPCGPNGLGTYVQNNNPQAGQSGDDIAYQEQQTCTGTNPGNPYAAISHGTSTAGLVGATTNNGIGIAAVNWNTKIMPLEALGDDGTGWTSEIAQAIHYAVDNGAQVINMSLGGASNDPTLQSAISYAYQHNVVVVAAAGNCGTGTEAGCDPAQPGQMLYPALYPHVIAVGATDQNDTRASFSSYGRGLDIMAPGDGTMISPLVDTTTTPFNYTNAYSGSLAGTSFASPMVASVASLIRSIRPTSTIDDVNALIMATARKPATMQGANYTTQYGHGIVDAAQAATVAESLQSQSSAPMLDQTGNYQSEHMFTSADTLSSGCTIIASTYCTVHWTESSTGFERYLPYQKASATGSTGWHWPGSTLGYGEWWGTAQSGDNQSASYLLFSK